jgi:hypothetical protein
MLFAPEIAKDIAMNFSNPNNVEPYESSIPAGNEKLTRLSPEP